jgi:7,8-dihydropterin-6-yl-methyl-4-(beta-D-ribofuranosyl)aminobenzene 5'-phosphate synthase
MPNAYYREKGQEKFDAIEDDTAIVMNLKSKGLVILSGCAHSGIINTVNYARMVTDIDQVYAVMGGFHLTGSHFEPFIEPTTQALKAINPVYVIPTHCTGRKAINYMEKELPDKFILNMAGTKLTFI